MIWFPKINYEKVLGILIGDLIFQYVTWFPENVTWFFENVIWFPANVNGFPEKRSSYFL